MGKGPVLWLAFCTAILATVIVATPVVASAYVEGRVVADATSGPSAGGEVLASVALNTPESRMLTLINNARADRGLRRLRVRASLCRAAEAHSASMLRLGYFSHSSASGETYAQRILRYGYSRTGCSYWSVGEVLGWGAGSTAGSARAIFRAWMGSTAHRTTIFAKRWRDVGIGMRRGSYAGIADVRMFAVDFGRRIY
ncbi:MAG TPA: CAP domain-containing protein [Thermoleophilia bacterium]|nr:CAP domain-containing protein [Thermoleophilia bacterium]